eukprot:GHRQ01036649.1.p1 GENE.GHRQ01036649.1~~GHRQ01036649.1.p1  ORF type:complete len:100 (+),score=22.72 GHRQ01036649.1:204-503(+)
MPLQPPPTWKYLPHTKHTYTLMGDRLTLQHFSKSKSRFCSRAQHKDRSRRWQPGTHAMACQGRQTAAAACLFELTNCVYMCAKQQPICQVGHINACFAA